MIRGEKGERVDNESNKESAEKKRKLRVKKKNLEDPKKEDIYETILPPGGQTI